MINIPVRIMSVPRSGYTLYSPIRSGFVILQTEQVASIPSSEAS